MDRVKVLDTGVLIGITVAQDQHHERCLDYVVGSDGKNYATPTVWDEFKPKIKEVRNQLSEEIKQHRKDIIREFGKTVLNRTDLVKIREQFLEADTRAHRFLFEFYDDLSSIELDELADKLSDMATEVFDDGAKESGGFESLVSGWSRGCDSYPEIREELLICEGDDPDVCIEAHHIAITVSDKTEIGTTNPRHFTEDKRDEPESRKENILRVTALVDVVDLSMGKYPF